MILRLSIDEDFWGKNRHVDNFGLWALEMYGGTRAGAMGDPLHVARYNEGWGMLAWGTPSRVWWDFEAMVKK